MHAANELRDPTNVIDAKDIWIATGEEAEVMEAFENAGAAMPSRGGKPRATKVSKKRGLYRRRNSN